MSVIIICSFLPMILLAIVKEKRADSPIVIFTIVWGLISFLASLRLYGMNEVSYKTYLMIFLGTFSFLVGGLLLSGKTIANFHGVERNETRVEKCMLLLQVLALISFTVSALKAINLIRSGLTLNDIYNMRIQMAYGSTTALTSDSSIQSIVLEYFAKPVLAISIPYSIIDFLKYKKKVSIMMTLIMLILSFINRGNRLDILCFFVTFILSQRLLNGGFNLSKKQKRYILIGVLLGAILLFYLSNMRDNFDIGNTAYSYLCGNVPFSDIKIKNLGTSFSYTIIVTSYQGIFRFLNQIIESLGMNGIEIINIAQKYADVESAVSITSSKGLFNAFVGPFYYLYCDAGWFGIIVFSFLNGCIAEHIYNEAFSNEDIIMKTLYLIIIVRGVIFSFYNYLFASIMYGMAIIILYFISKVTKSKRREI